MEFGFEFTDDLFDDPETAAILSAKAERIAIARAAASNYSAKIEDSLVSPPSALIPLGE